MKSKDKTKIIILITFGIIFALSPTFTFNLIFNTRHNKTSSGYSYDFNLDNKNLKTLATSGKIHIDNNWTATKSAGICTGNGTYSDPYIIKDLVIDGGSSGNCIWIENSDVYFKIENCTAYHSGGGANAGIELSNANNGNLTDNNCSDNIMGIYLSNSDNNTISGNTANNNSLGIELSYSENNTVSGNIMNECGLFLAGNLDMLTSLTIDTTNLVNEKTLYYYVNEIDLEPNNFTNAGQVILVSCNDSIISNCSAGISLYYCNNNNVSGNILNNNSYGIFLYYSDYNNISGNILNNNFYGIFLYYSDYNTISGNTANNNSLGILLFDSNNNTISGNIANNNNQIGIELNDLCNDNSISGNTANNNNQIGIELNDFCNNNTISGNTANYNDNIGIDLSNSHHNIISGNTAIYNDNIGIDLSNSIDNIISGNIANNNQIGICLNYSDYNIIKENIINYNNLTGIIVDNSIWNYIILNCFNNPINAKDYGSNNRWDNGIKGNYWADYTGSDADANGIGDVPYNIMGSAGSQDHFPLMQCPFSAQEGGGIPIELIILISVITGGAVIGIATILLIRHKRKRIY